MKNVASAIAPLGLVLAVLLSCGLGEKADQVKALAENLQDAAEKFEAGDTTGAKDAFGRALGGGEAVEAVDFRTLVALLPERLSGFERVDASGEKSSVMGMGTSRAEARYEAEDRSRHVNVTISDMGSVRGVGMLGVNWLMMEVDRESDRGYERTVTYKGYPAHESFETGGDWSRGELSVFAADRFIVTVRGQNVDEATLRDVLTRVDLSRLEALKNEGVKAVS